MTRKEAREAVFSLLFETDFRKDATPEEVFDGAIELRELETDEYVKSAYFGAVEKMSFADELIEKYSRGWKIARIAPVSRATMRLAVYEMYFRDDVPDNVAVNEAIELIKKYDDAEKARPFVNGILNSILRAKKAEENA